MPTSLLNGVWSPTTSRGQGRRHGLIKPRERTDFPQLTDVPSDLRVNGARHASRDPVPPSKPIRPREVSRCAAAGRSSPLPAVHCTPSCASARLNRRFGPPAGRRRPVRLVHARETDCLLTRRLVLPLPAVPCGSPIPQIPTAPSRQMCRIPAGDGQLGARPGCHCGESV